MSAIIPRERQRGRAPGAAPARRRTRSRVITPALLLLLPAVVVAVTLAYPLYRQVIMSFQEYGLAQQFGQPAEFIGLDNYIAVLSDGTFWAVLVRSILFCLVTAFATMAVGVGIAVLMQRAGTIARVFLSVCLMLVWAMPAIASLTVWQWMLDARLGVFNYLLVHLGLTQFEGYAWLATDPFIFLVIVGLIVAWASMPLVVISTYAALTQVGEETLEAAQIDGAGFWTSLRYIVLPVIKPILFLIGILQVIWDFRVFTQVYVLQQAGGNSEATDVLGTYVYRVGIGQGNYGMASALALIMLAVALVMTWQYIRTLLKQGDVE